jgi:hypothetical protein
LLFAEKRVFLSGHRFGPRAFCSTFDGKICISEFRPSIQMALKKSTSPLRVESDIAVSKYINL